MIARRENTKLKTKRKKPLLLALSIVVVDSGSLATSSRLLSCILVPQQGR